MTNPNPEQDTKARLTGDLKHFLKPYFSFRLYVQFKKDKKKSHFYGNEHQCTFSQLKHAQVPNILMSKLKGYTDLISLEKKWNKDLYAATIYMRPADHQPFDTICRSWYKGEVKEINDPLITEENDNRTLYYFFQNNNLFITTEDPAAVDFKTTITNALTKRNTPGNH